MNSQADIISLICILEVLNQFIKRVQRIRKLESSLAGWEAIDTAPLITNDSPMR